MNESTTTPKPHTGAPSLLTLLQLVRIPNVFTAMADVVAGYLIVRGGLHEPAKFFSLLGASVCLYLAGMVLNDVYDVEIDARERPQRPIPSGRVSLEFARRLGFGLLLAGLAFSLLACFTIGSVRPGIVAAGLALCIWLYDSLLKRTPVAPLLMGACRSLNILLAMSADPAPWVPFNWLLAAGLGIYIAGVTVFARKEAGASSQLRLALGALVAIAGIALLGLTPHLATGAQNLMKFPLYKWNQLWILLGALIGWRMVRATLRPEPAVIQPAVKVAILSVIMLDAALCLGWLALGGPGGIPWVLMILLLLLPAMFLGRWIYST
jgi:4-hydroxybenzoate polyprenyltransferase